MESSSGSSGPNGSGKSTLLKCIAGIYGTDSGRVAVTGRLSPFLEMGVGFKEELHSPGERGAQRHPARPQPGADPRAHGRHHRLRRPRAVRRHEPEELLVGDAGAARVLAGDPGGRRHPAPGRGLRGRGRGVHAEVLRAVSAAQGGGPNGGPRDAQHEPDKPVLRPSAAARLRAGGDARRPGVRWPTATASSTRVWRASASRRRPAAIEVGSAHLPRRGVAFADPGRPNDLQPVGVRRRPSRARSRHRDARQDGVQAPLPRLGARLRVVGDAAADAVRRPLRRVLGHRRARTHQALPGVRALRRGPVDLLLRGDHRRGELVGAEARASCARCASLRSPYRCRSR